MEDGTDRRGPDPAVFMYVNDTTVLDIIGVDSATLHLTTEATQAEYNDLAIGRDFNMVEERADDINMKVNELKTQLLIIGPRNGHVNTATISSRTGEQIKSVRELKLVGFTFGTEPGVGAHVKYIRERFRRRVWMLYHLRKAGFRGRPFYALYCVYIRSVIEYCLAVYHSMLTKGQAEDLERLQRLVIRICFNFEDPMETIMMENGIESLGARRARRCDAFTRKAITNPRFGHWFRPRGQVEWNIRNRRIIRETRASTSRRLCSPLAFPQRRPNDLGLMPRQEWPGGNLRYRSQVPYGERVPTIVYYIFDWYNRITILVIRRIWISRPNEVACWPAKCSADERLALTRVPSGRIMYGRLFITSYVTFLMCIPLYSCPFPKKKSVKLTKTDYTQL